MDTSQNSSVPILVTDDEESLRAVVSQVLAEDGHEVTQASSGEEAWEAFCNRPFPLVITDVRMGGMSGIDLLRRIKEASEDTQVVIMTSDASSDTVITAMRAGAYDYLLKPFEEIELISNVANRALEKIRLMEDKNILMKQLAQKNEELKKANAILNELSIHDTLTEAYNPRFFLEFLKREVARSSRFKRTFSLLSVGVDHFAEYADANGTQEGDKILVTIATILAQGLRKADIIARYGGEKFFVLLPETPKEKAINAAGKIKKYMDGYPFAKRETLPGGRLTVNVGVATYPQDGEQGTFLIKRAEDALAEARRSEAGTA